MDGVQLPQGYRVTASKTLYTTKFPDVPGTHLIKLVRMKDHPVALTMVPLGWESTILGIQRLYILLNH